MHTDCVQKPKESYADAVGTRRCILPVEIASSRYNSAEVQYLKSPPDDIYELCILKDQYKGKAENGIWDIQFHSRK